MIALTAVLALLVALALTGYIVTKDHPERAKHSRVAFIVFCVLLLILGGVLLSGVLAGWRGW